jgi:uncharacterized lipoprotein YajG
MKTRLIAILAALGMFAMVQGCALQTQSLRVDPEVKVKSSEIGAGRTIGLGVSDVRTDKKLGEVGDPDREMVDVLVEEDPSPAVYDRVKGGLEQLGFIVVPYSDAMERTLQIEIRTLELQSVKTPFTFETELQAVVGSRAASGNAYHERQFNVRTRKDGAVPPFKKDSTMLVNTAISQALEDMFADEEILTLLAE